MDIDGYDQLGPDEREIADGLLSHLGVGDGATGSVSAETLLGLDACELLCYAKLAAAVLACGKNPVCLWQAYEQFRACKQACD